MPPAISTVVISTGNLPTFPNCQTDEQQLSEAKVDEA